MATKIVPSTMKYLGSAPFSSKVTKSAKGFTASTNFNGLIVKAEADSEGHATQALQAKVGAMAERSKLPTR